MQARRFTLAGFTLALATLHRPFARDCGPRSFQHFELDIIVHMLDDLTETAHIKPLSADRASHEMVGLGFSDAVNVNAGLGHSITGYSKTTPSGSCSLNHSSAASGFANTLR